MSLPALPLDVLRELLAQTDDVPSSSFKVDALGAQASARRYHRVRFEGGETVLVMQMPANAGASEEASGSATARDRLPFLEMATLLNERGVRIPIVHTPAPHHGLLILEDLGDQTFEDRLLAEPDQWVTLYGRAVDTLADMHSRCDGLPSDSLPRSRAFDEALFRRELHEFRDEALLASYGGLDEDEQACFQRAADTLIAALAEMPTGFVHRDYQSRNLMWVQDELVIIDFQDALMGPTPYDLVALLCDSYVNVPERIQRAMIERYIERSGLDPAATNTFTRAFWKVALQRKLKDTGRFFTIDRHRGNADFLQHIPQSLVYVSRALRALGDEVAELSELLHQKIPGFPAQVAVPASVRA